MLAQELSGQIYNSQLGSSLANRTLNAIEGHIHASVKTVFRRAIELQLFFAPKIAKIVRFVCDLS